MSNSKLIGKVFPVPDKILLELGKNLKKFSDKRESKGFNRAIFILERKSCTYQQLKRIKNYFDNINDDNYNEVEYLLNGGDMMKKWVDFKLQEARRSVHGTKKARKHAGMENQFKSEPKDNLKAITPKLKNTPEFMSTSDLMEEVNKIKEIYKKLN
jgi:hypothetical protein